MKRAAVVAALGLAGPACGKPTVDADRLVARIQKALADKRVELAELHCPAGRALAQGDAFSCTGATADGQAIAIDVNQIDGAGNVMWQLHDKQLLDTERIRSEILPKLGAGLSLACPHQVAIVAVGDVTTCTVTKDGHAGKLMITTDDGSGNISYKYEN